MKCQIIVLAAGDGTRMNSAIPKVMHKVCGVPMLEMVISNAMSVSDDVILVHSQQLLSHITPYANTCKFVVQHKPLGTAHAVFSAIDTINHNVPSVVIYGDNPLISGDIISQLLNHITLTNSAIATLAFQRDNPGQYGRIVTDDNGNLLKIVEFKDATNDDQKITLCNSGIMAFAPNILKKYLQYAITQNVNSSEFYLTNMISICRNYNERVSYLLSADHKLIVGINTQEELTEANNILEQLTNRND